ncbi:hypothetical protein JCM17380_44670 [Desulfosporosinus burensis]
MKIYYLGSVINTDTFERIVKNSKDKPSAAPQRFESLMLEGMKSIKDIELNIHSMPAIAAYPKSNVRFWGNKKEIVAGGYQITWIPCINLDGIKQITSSITTFFSVLFFLLSTISTQDRIVLTYGVEASTALPIHLLSRLFRCNRVAIIPDLPDYMYQNRKKRGLQKLIQNIYIFLSNKASTQYDGYILLTKEMAKKLGIENCPFAVIEGFAGEEHVLENIQGRSKAIMYAGALYANMGIDLLVEAFTKFIRQDIELWLFGYGSYAEQIMEIAKVDSRIKFFGRVPHNEVLDYEKKAMLLVNLRNNDDEYTKFSFPSKTLEYMSSGTPLLMTRLDGIPREYFDYVLTLDERNSNALCNKFEEIFSMDDSELENFGLKAKQFVLSYKNPGVQAKILVSLLKSVNSTKK